MAKLSALGTATPLPNPAPAWGLSDCAMQHWGRGVGDITDLVKERVLGAPERAAVLRVLATVPGLEYQGTTTNRAGRNGKTFSPDSNH